MSEHDPDLANPPNPPPPYDKSNEFNKTHKKPEKKPDKSLRAKKTTRTMNPEPKVVMKHEGLEDKEVRDEVGKKDGVVQGVFGNEPNTNVSAMFPKLNSANLSKNSYDSGIIFDSMPKIPPPGNNNVESMRNNRNEVGMSSGVKDFEMHENSSHKKFVSFSNAVQGTNFVGDNKLMLVPCTTKEGRKVMDMDPIIEEDEINIVRPKAVVNVVKGNNLNAVKASACWDQGVMIVLLKAHDKRQCPILRTNEEIRWRICCFLGGNLKGGEITREKEVYLPNFLKMIKPVLLVKRESSTEPLALWKKMYCLVVTDDYSRFTWVFFLATKDETSGILKSFITEIENLVDHKVKVIRCDNGTQFNNREMNQFCEVNVKPLGVFNSRTRIVEENLHIRFSESTPNVVGTPSLNGFAGTKASDNADPKSSHDDGSKPSSDDGKKVDEDQRKESEYHPLDQVIGDLQSATQTRKMSKNLEEHGFRTKKVIHALKDPRWIEAMQKELLQFLLTEVWTLSGVYQMGNTRDYRHLNGVFKNKKDEKGIVIRNMQDGCSGMSSMGELTFFSRLQVKQKNDGIFISQDKYVEEILKKFGFTEVKTASTPMETQKPLLKDEDGEEVDVHMYRLMIGSLMYLTSSRPDIMFAVCACARYQVNPKVSHLHVVKRIFRYLKGQPKLGLWYPKDSSFDLVAYTDSDYAGASLDRKSTTGGKAKKSVRLMMEKLLLMSVKLFGMELKLILFWSTVMAKTINGEEQLHALVDGKKIIITESSVRRDLQLADEEGVDCLPNSTIFEQLTLMGTNLPLAALTSYLAVLTSPGSINNHKQQH
ncbi:uncharacterized mitochondrial protein-like protein [Tanacetum coccineum]